jgi:hypothetical protein
MRISAPLLDVYFFKLKTFDYVVRKSKAVRKEQFAHVLQTLVHTRSNSIG